MPTLVFLSHSSKDDDTVTRIHDEIEAATGEDVWVDHRDLDPGDRWQVKIDEALAKCSHMLVILSKESVKSAEVEAEWRDALLRGKALLPVVIDDIELTAIPSRLRTIQSVNLVKDWKVGIQQLIDAITRAHKGTSAAGDFMRWPVTGMIERMLTSIPISGREQDIETVQRYLKQAPTSILGVGGLGKSRMAVEIVLTQAETDGAVWHVCGDYTTPDDVYDLLREHLGLEATTSTQDVLKRLRQEHLLVVIDNAESIGEQDARRKDYVKLVDELYATKGVHMLLTSRVAWAEIKASKQHPLDEPKAAAAEKIVKDMAAFFEIKDYQAEDYAPQLAKAARYHPRLIEWAVGKLAIDDPKTVIRELTQLKSADVQDALNEMIQKTIEQMRSGEHGEEAFDTLAQWSVCRGGFTREAAGYLQQAQEHNLDADSYVNAKEPMALLDEDQLSRVLKVLTRWQFIRRNVTEKGQARYTIEPLVMAAVTADESAYQTHFDYYKALARRHHEKQDYLGLAPESDNLEAAFEWAMGETEYEKALNLANAATKFLYNRGRYRQILEWHERLVAKLADHPDKSLWANAQNSLGSDLQNIPLGNRFENLKRAVAAYEAALVYWTADAVPLYYAGTHNNLGNAYRYLAHLGEQEANLKRAVAAYEAALVYRTAEAAPLDYAMTQNNLGNAYGDLAQLSEREANLQRAVAAYEEALVYHTVEAAPLAYAQTQNNLGLAYRDLAQLSEREANLKRAVAAYEAALQHYTPEAAPLAYAMTQNNLGNAYRALAQVSEREANLKRAVAAYEAALVYRTPEAAPLAYATTQNNLGNAYRDLAQLGERESNLKRAVAAFETALVYRTAEAAPLDYAATQNNLGNAYSDLAQVSEREANLKRAVAAYEAALVYRTAEAAPLAYAETRYNMALLYRDLAKVENREENLRKAITTYQDTLRIRTLETAPLDYANTQWGMGMDYDALDETVTAIGCWREAERAFRAMGVDDKADLMLRNIAAAEKRL